MSGHSSGGGAGSGEFGGTGGSGGRGVDCSALEFETHISSPKQSEINKLKVGDILDIELDENLMIVQVVNNGVVVGGLVENAPILILCLEQGFKYSATVRSISGAAVLIFVQSV